MQKTAPEAAGLAAGTSRAKPGLVAFTGTGPGDPGLLTLRAADLLGEADLVIGSGELTRRVAHLLPERATVIDADQEGPDPATLIVAAQEGQLVIRLCPGDPLLFGPAAAEADACAKAAVRLEIVPGMPAATEDSLVSTVRWSVVVPFQVMVIGVASAQPAAISIFAISTGPPSAPRMTRLPAAGESADARLSSEACSIRRSGAASLVSGRPA